MKPQWQQLRALAAKWRWLWLPPLSSLVLMLLLDVVLYFGFGTRLRSIGVIADWVTSSLFAYWLYALLRPWWMFLATQVLVVGTLYFANGFKIYFFGIPVRPTDFQDVPVLLDQVEGWRFLAMLTPLVLTALVFLAGLRWRRRTLPILLGGVLLVAVPLWLAPKPICRALDAAVGFLPFGDVKDFSWRGPLLYLYNEKARELASVMPAPSQAQVVAALDRAHLPHPLPPPAGIAKRDVYVFMMETFWDPSVLSAAHYTRDPLAPPFRALWDQAGESKAMVPVFGNGTANSEFEVLCGEPAYGGGVMVFMTVLERPTMCLPRFLARLGYHTTAVTPDDYGTWNRGAVFPYVGFQRFYTASNLDVTDRNGQFQSNQQLFDETDQLMAGDGLSSPRFTYISTDSGHYPYDLNEAKRPTLIHSDYQNEHVQRYANVVYYDSMELADYIARIRARDPDALIVAFGDHLPVLGSGLAVMVESHLTAHHEKQFKPRMFVVHQSTPLLVIDGRRGPVKLGYVSLYEVPRLVLSLLGAKQPTEFDAFAPPPGVHVRPYDGRLITLEEDGSVKLCTPESRAPACGPVMRWDADMQTLRDDILSGKGFTDVLLYGSDPHRLDMPDAGVSYTAAVKADGHPHGQ